VPGAARGADACAGGAIEAMAPAGARRSRACVRVIYSTPSIERALLVILRAPRFALACHAGTRPTPDEQLTACCSIGSN
jgi:hypothetical protein